MKKVLFLLLSLGNLYALDHDKAEKEEQERHFHRTYNVVRDDLQTYYTHARPYQRIGVFRKHFRQVGIRLHKNLVLMNTAIAKLPPASSTQEESAKVIKENLLIMRKERNIFHLFYHCYSLQEKLYDLQNRIMASLSYEEKEKHLLAQKESLNTIRKAIEYCPCPEHTPN